MRPIFNEKVVKKCHFVGLVNNARSQLTCQQLQAEQKKKKKEREKRRTQNANAKLI